MTTCDNCSSIKVVTEANDERGIIKGKCIDCLADEIVDSIVKNPWMLKKLEDKLAERFAKSQGLV